MDAIVFPDAGETRENVPVPARRSQAAAEPSSRASARAIVLAVLFVLAVLVSLLVWGLMR